MFEGSVEVYYKMMQNEVDYRPGADLLLNPKVEGQLVYGSGTITGLNFLYGKNTENSTDG